MRECVLLFVSVTFAAAQVHGDGCKSPVVINAENGTIYSPYYEYFPEYSYPPNLRCRYTITVPDNQNISIRFLLPFDTEGTMTGSCNDYVMFYTGIRPSLVNCIRSATAQAAYQVVAGPFCGSNNDTNWSFIVGASNVTMEFCTTRTDERQGFGLSFSATDQPEANLTQPGAVPTTAPSFTECGRTVIHTDPTNETIIESPGYPGSYPANLNCTWIVVGTPGSELSIKAEGIFDVENSTRCVYDSLVIHDVVGNITLGTFCGRLGPDVRSRGNQVTIRFRTDRSVERQGFRLRIREPKCSAEHSRCPNDPKGDECAFHPAMLCDGKKDCPNGLDEDCPHGCGISEARPLLSTVGRIVGGIEARPHSWPWQVALVNGPAQRFSCGGAVIDRYFVLTAAHCCAALNIAELKIRVGEHSAKGSREPNAVDYEIRQAAMHPEYVRAPVPVNDYCLLETKLGYLLYVGQTTDSDDYGWPRLLAAASVRIFPLSSPRDCSRQPCIIYNKEETLHERTPFSIGCVGFSPILYSKDVTPICLPTAMDAPDGKTCFLSGWGELDQDDWLTKGNKSNDPSGKQEIGQKEIATSKATSDVLRQVDVKIFNYEECNRQYNYMLTPAMICAWNPDRDSCQGDSGGPLQCPSADDPNRFELVGVVSFAYGCADKRYAGVNARVSHALDWITNTILRHERSG